MRKKLLVLIFVIFFLCNPFVLNRLWNDIRLLLFVNQLQVLSYPPQVKLVKTEGEIKKYPNRSECIFVARSYLKTVWTIEDIKAYYNDQTLYVK